MTYSLATLEELRSQLEYERERSRAQITNLRMAEGRDQPEILQMSREEESEQSDQAMDQAEWDRMHIEGLALSEHLAEVEHALAKFQIGTYGLCEECGISIPEARLRALPEARCDIEHESAFEQSIHAEEQHPEGS